MEAGIVGLPNVGKSTLFNALTCSQGAQSANYPFCTIEPNEGIVSVPDDRLERITNDIVPQKLIPANITERKFLSDALFFRIRQTGRHWPRGNHNVRQPAEP